MKKDVILYNFNLKSDMQPLVLGLGFFDCVHLGHKKLIETVKDRAISIAAVPSVLTFSTNLSTVKQQQIYTFNERIVCMSDLGVENVIFAEFDNGFQAMSGADFISTLMRNYNVKEIVVGADFRFGKGAECGINDLKNMLDGTDCALTIVDFYEFDGKKLSTSSIRPILENGDVETVNKLLSEPYFMLSTVRAQKGRGHTFGFPTANMQLNSSRVLPSQGVYATSIELKGKRYKCVTNVGIKPTFDDDEYAIESFILDFNENIYGEQVKLIFWKKLREIIKFSCAEELSSQIYSDITARLLIK